MAWIRYHSTDHIASQDRVDDDDNIIRIHAVHSRVMRLHYDLYVELMHGPSPLSRRQREMIATAVSAKNGCRY